MAGLTTGKAVKVTGIETVEDWDIGIADDNAVEIDSATVASGEYARFTANGLESRSEAEFKSDYNLEIGTDVLAQQTIGIADDNLVETDSATIASGEYAKFTANGLESKSAIEVKTDLSLENVDNTSDATKNSASATLTNKVITADDNTLKIFTEALAADHTLTASECYGAVYYVTSAATLTLPTIAEGMHLTVCTVGAVAASVKAGASDLIMLDGTALDDGDKITNLSTTGDIAVLTYYSADGWYASTNSWTDGGA